MACCPPNAHGYLASTRDHKGSKITVPGGVEAYSAGTLGPSGRAILICPDIWGWDSGRLRNIADHLAEAGYLVVVPKILQPPCVTFHGRAIALYPQFCRLEGGTDGDALPPEVAPWIPETGGWSRIAQWLKENMVRFGYANYHLLGQLLTYLFLQIWSNLRPQILLIVQVII